MGNDPFVDFPAGCWFWGYKQPLQRFSSHLVIYLVYLVAAVPKIWNSLCPELYYTNGSNEYMFKRCFKALKKFEYSQFECEIIDCKSCQS